MMSSGLNVVHDGSHTARDDIFQLGADERRALSGFDMLKFNYLIDAAVHLKGDAVFEITSDYHIKYLRIVCRRGGA